MESPRNNSGSVLIDPPLEERARAQDREARSELLVRARRSLVAFCQRYLVNIDAAEDAAHDVLAALASATWPAGSFRSFAFRSARNRCLDLLARRRDGRAGNGSLSSFFPPAQTGPGTAVGKAEQYAKLRRHLRELPPMKMEVLVLKYFDSLSRKEIADVLGITEGLVRSRLSEARKELRSRMEHEA